MCDGEGYKKSSWVSMTLQDKKQTWVELGNSLLSPPTPYLEGKRVVPTVFPPLMGTPVLRKQRREERIPVLFRKLHFPQEYFLQLKMNPIRVEVTFNP
ncbi:hypothetical protein CDAR_192441 [Caerostris darwini]|uniref:Uncharacterized protein n=1 Tax=Caerostris darwini TaxID=1538125 RepID=A0AAV4WAX6_9ARAC|nr:hypothetical protein CDAR_192441 [Caerostris darwini]